MCFLAFFRSNVKVKRLFCISEITCYASFPCRRKIWFLCPRESGGMFDSQKTVNELLLLSHPIRRANFLSGMFRGKLSRHCNTCYLLREFQGQYQKLIPKTSINLKVETLISWVLRCNRMRLVRLFRMHIFVEKDLYKKLNFPAETSGCPWSLYWNYSQN